MWGINPATITTLIAAVAAKELISNRHGFVKIARDEIIKHTAKKEIALAKVLAKAMAEQDEKLHAKLKAELHDQLPEEDWQNIFGHSNEINPAKH